MLSSHRPISVVSLVLICATGVVTAQTSKPAKPKAAPASKPAGAAKKVPQAVRRVSPALLDEAEFLKRMIELDRLTAPPPAGERTCMFSSYDRASKLDDAGREVKWDANADWGQFIRKTDDGWDVMAEMTGPGVITRFWSANPHGRVRFVLDGETVLDAPFEDYFNGKMPPFTEPLCYMNPDNGGKNCYLPIPFAKSCRVDAKDSKSYYQVNLVALPTGTQVEAFKPALSDAAKAALAEVSKVWTDGFTDKQLFVGGKAPPVSVEPKSDDGTLKKGEKLELEEPGEGTIRALYVAWTDRTAPRELYAFHHCVLRIFVDGEKTPSIETPLIDFFGSGFEPRDFTSLVLGTAHATDMPVVQARPDKQAEPRPLWYCYFPMPFTKGVRIEIENLSGKKIGLMLTAHIDPAAPPADALRFRAGFHKVDPAATLDMPIVEADGRGRIVGCLLNVDCPRATWWGEGDDKVWIDGEKFPSYFGTGSEDYIGDAWGLRPHTRPVQGATLVRPYGKQSAYRWHISDSIEFHKSVRFTIENWQFGGFKDTYYSMIGYWYGEPGKHGKFDRIAMKDLTPPGLRIPGAVEIEGHVSAADKNLGEKWGTELKQKFAGMEELSGEAAVNIATPEIVNVALLSKEECFAEIKLRAVPGRPFEAIEISGPKPASAGGDAPASGNAPLSTTIKYDRKAEGTYSVGECWLKAGDNVFAVRCSKPATLDCWIVEKIFVASRYAIEAETLKVTGEANCPHEVQRLDRSRWSRGSQIWGKPTQAGAWIEIEVPIEKAGKYKLGVVYTVSGDYGIVQASVNGTKTGDPVDNFGDLKPGPIRQLGVMDLPAGPLKLKFEVVGKNEKSPGYFLGIDCIVLETVKS